MSNGEDVLIVGAGPSGMSCATELAKSGSGFNISVVEKEGSIGGLAKTLEFREDDLLFRTDIGPHRFFSRNGYLYDVIEDLLNEKWVLVPRQTRQYIEGKFYNYPIDISQALKNIGPGRSMKIIASYLSSFMNYKVLKRDVVSFEDYIVANFGRALGEMNMLNYTEKIWGINCSQIHSEWAKQRIKGLNLVSAMKNAMKKKKTDKPKTLIDNFYYPTLGTGLIYETMKERIEGSGGRIHTKSMPRKVVHDGRRIKSVEVDVNGDVIEMKPDYLVESIPITEFVSLLSPKPPRNVLEAAAKLRWRSQMYLFITLDRERVLNDNWVYFPDKHIPFSRIAEMKNFSGNMSPKGKTSLFVEFFVFEDDDMWKMGKDGLFKLAMKHFKELGFFTSEDVRNYYLIKRSNVYPVYSLDYKEHLSVIKDYLDGFDNLFYIGRPGRFKYNNQDHSLEMGITAAKSIIDGKRYDIERAASDNEYFEKGSIKLKADDVEKRSYNWMILEDRGGDNEEKGNG